MTNAKQLIEKEMNGENESSINEGAVEKSFASYLEEAIQSYSDEEDDNFIRSIRSFKEMGVMTLDAGLVIKATSGTFHITIKKN